MHVSSRLTLTYLFRLQLLHQHQVPELRQLAVNNFGSICDIAPESVAKGAVQGVESLTLYGAEQVPRLASAPRTMPTAGNSAFSLYAKQLETHGTAFPFLPEAAGCILHLRPTNESVRDLTLLYGIPPMKGLYKADPSRCVNVCVCVCVCVAPCLCFYLCLCLCLCPSHSPLTTPPALQALPFLRRGLARFLLLCRIWAGRRLCRLDREQVRLSLSLAS